MSRDFSKYENPLVYPTKPKMVCSQCSQTFSKGDNFCSQCGHNVNMDYIRSIGTYSNLRKEYTDKSKEIYERFTDDCLTDAGLIGHPKKKEIFAYVVNRDGDRGLEDIYHDIIDIALLFKKSQIT